MDKSLKPFYIKKLQKEFKKRQDKNSSYSLRAFAKFLGVDSSVLSAIFGGKRSLSKKNALAISKKICPSAQEEEKFIRSAESSKTLKKIMLSPLQEKDLPQGYDYSAIVSEWEHFAILTLTEVKDFSSDPKWISERLGLSLARVQSVLKNLQAAGLLVAVEGVFQVASGATMASAPVISPETLKKASESSLEIALKKLDKACGDASYFSSVSIAVSTAQIEEACELIREFRQRFCAVFEEGEKDHVYKLNFQFFSLTEMNK